jgi:hypothetical protein
MTNDFAAIHHYADLSGTDHLIKSKPDVFWCYSHLADLPLGKQSADDPRYCQDCYGMLMDEYWDMVKTRGKHRPWWVPVNGDKRSCHDMTPQAVQQGAVIMHTVINQKSTVCKIIPPVTKTTMPVLSNGRGRKEQPLPVDQIKELSAQGMGSKMITAKLKKAGISVSYSTVQRRIKKILEMQVPV